MNFTIEPVFIDTTVLIDARDDRNTDRRERAGAWLAAITDLDCARTDLQVLHELTRGILKNGSGRALRAVQDEVETIGAWGARRIDQDDTELAWLVRKNLGYQWFDCRLVAAARLAGRRYFPTEDMAHGAVFEGLTLITPFRASPGDVLQRN